jgi:endo-1,4-beta-xylanase
MQKMKKYTPAELTEPGSKTGPTWIKNLLSLIFLTITGYALAQDNPLSGKISPLYEKLWKDPAIENRIAEGIRTNRMGTATLRFVDSKGTPLKNVDIDMEQTCHEFLFGANIFMLGGFPTPEQNRQFETSFTSIFNYATVPFYWSDLEPEQGKPRFAKESTPIYRRPPPDAVVEFCQKNGIEMKGHPLVWHQWYPKWRPDDPQEAMKANEKRIDEIAARYAESIRRWEVVNEPVERDLWAVKWFNLPDDYLTKSFLAAGMAFPKKDKMMINEATTFSWLKFNGDSSKYYNMIRGLLNKGLRIDEIGMQLHCFSAATWQPVLDGIQFAPADMYKVLDKYSDLGRPIGITELTLPTLPNSAVGEAVQATVARNWYRLWFSHPGVNAITWWNMVDGTAAPGEDKTNAGMLRKGFSPKLSYTVLHDLIKKEWWTIIKKNSGQGASLKVHGFYGNYQITSTYKGKIVKQNISLTKKGQNDFEIQFK